MIETTNEDRPADADRNEPADRDAADEKIPVLRLRGARWTSRFAANGSSTPAGRRTRAS